MQDEDNQPAMLAADAAMIVTRTLTRDRRVLLIGAPGAGKSTLAADIADYLIGAGRCCQCISADPGSPAFGIPGTVALGARVAGAWQSTAFEPLCTLDAGRFRLPLVTAVRRLSDKTSAGTLLVDCPGVVRGVAGSELLQGLLEAIAADLILVITRSGQPPPLAAELAAQSVEVCLVMAAMAARRPGKRVRAQGRSEQWGRYLSKAAEQDVDLGRLSVIGTPPPLDEPDAWTGRQIALLGKTRCLALAEVTGLAHRRLTLRAPHSVDDADTLLVRDAARGPDGLLASAAPFVSAGLSYLPPAGLLPDTALRQGPRPVGRVGRVDVALVNGLFGDPLLHLKMRDQARSLLFDLGGGSRLSARIAHQVSDVFISHAHMDHLGGFLWLLRSRVGVFPACRLYGPPGLAQHINGLIKGFLWDRVGDSGPAFAVHELHGDLLQRFHLQAGTAACETHDVMQVRNGIVHAEPGFQVRAVLLDHHTPVLAYAFEPDSELNVRKDALQRLGLAPGGWLNDLKQRYLEHDHAAYVDLPDGNRVSAGELAPELLAITPGRRLVYATDLADTTANRTRLIDLARNAHTLFLEAVFTEADVARARAHGHLTARACGEIADAAAVARLVPFHFSRRYADDLTVVFDEIEAVCRCTVRPGPRALGAAEAGGEGAAAGHDADYSVERMRGDLR